VSNASRISDSQDAFQLHWWGVWVRSMLARLLWVRSLLGLPPEEGAHRTENATRCVAASPMSSCTPHGLKALPSSPLLVDTPGMFDADSTLADCAVRYLGKLLYTPLCLELPDLSAFLSVFDVLKSLYQFKLLFKLLSCMVDAGSMALYIIVLPAIKSGRIDSTMLARIAEIASAGKPTLICLNQFSRYVDLWKDAADANEACEAICKSIIEKVPGARAFVQLCLSSRSMTSTTMR